MKNKKKKLKILIYDDYPDLEGAYRSAFEDVLGVEGFDLNYISELFDLIQLKKDFYDLAIIDWKLGDTKSGKEIKAYHVIPYIQSEKKVIITGFSKDQEAIDYCKSAGMPIIGKPFYTLDIELVLDSLTQEKKKEDSENGSEGIIKKL